MNPAQLDELQYHIDTCAVIERSGGDVQPMLDAEIARFNRKMKELKAEPEPEAKHKAGSGAKIAEPRERVRADV